jgi:hypothetical protein
MMKLLTAVFTFAAIGLAQAASLKVESMTWFNVSKTFDTNKVYSETNGGSFNISRQYITVSGTLSDAVKARLTLDIVNGLNMLKYAYVDAKIAPEFVITVGLQKTYFGNLPNWEYPLPVKDATEIDSDLSATASADLGIGFSGKLAGMLEYHLQILNGEGYKGWNTVNDPTYAILADINAMPLEKMLKVGLSVRYADKESKKLYGSTTKLATFGVDAYADLNISGLGVLVQFISMNNRMYGDTNFINGNLISGMVSYDIMPELSAMVRFDMYDPAIKEGSTNDNYNAIYVGLGYKPVKGLNIKPMFAYMFGNKYGQNPNMMLMLQAEYKFGLEIVKEEKKADTVKPVEAPAPVSAQ